jgi:hypothetical protein
MQRFHTVFVVVVLILLIFSSACAPRPAATQVPTEAATVAPVPVTGPTAEATEAPDQATEAPIETAEAPTSESIPSQFEDFNPNNFSNPTNITNKWLPLKPGMQYVYEGITNDADGNQVSRRLVVTVTDLTKVVNGVRTVVSWDRDYNSNSVVEAELAFYAQDNNGTIWRLGEHPEEYDNGTFIEAPTWFSGIADSVAGIEMQGNPQLQQDYSQGWAPSVNFTDRGQVSQMDQKLCVPMACYNNVLMIDETSQAEPDAHQLKYFAPGVGNIKVGWLGEDASKERLELTKVNELSADQLAEARAEALQEEQHAYLVSPHIYGKTQPMESPAP